MPFIIFYADISQGNSHCPIRVIMTFITSICFINVKLTLLKESGSASTYQVVQNRYNA